MNLLTDKTLIEFEKWTSAAHNICSDYEHAAFFDLPEVCQYALYQEFFDSVKQFISVQPIINNEKEANPYIEFWYWIIDESGNDLQEYEELIYFPSRSLALKAAILASDGIFNSKI